MSFRAFFLSLTVTTMLFYSVVGTTTVYADDGTGDEPVATEPAPPAEDGQPTAEAIDVAVEAQPVDVEPVEVVMEQLPENTTVTVLDTEGEALPLASQEAVDVIESDYDPIWCPAGTDPIPGNNNCTESFNSFNALLTFLKANEGNAVYQQNGTIYIQQGAYLGGETSINFNNYNFTQLNNYDLTLQGGWDTTWNPIQDPSDPAFPTYTTTTFKAPITIGSGSNPWAGSLTIKNIDISNVSNKTGLTLYSEEDINLSEVTVTNSQSGASLNAGGNVQVDDSKFNNNAKGGATIEADGYVLVNYSEFKNNGSTKTDGYGVKINSGNEVDLYDVNASFNELYGADITAAGPVYVDGIFSGNVSYSYNCNTKTANGGYGIKVVSQDGIYFGTYASSEANDNYEFGAYLEGQTVKVESSTFNNNGYGLKIVSSVAPQAGFVTLQTVTANNNKLFGADIQANASVTVNNSFFDGNKSYTYSCKGTTYQGYGLKIVTTDGIFLTDVDASYNNLFGAHLDGDRVFIFGDLNGVHGFNNNGSDAGNTGKGLEIISDTTVTLSDVYANDNQVFGADIQATGDVSIYSGFFNGNQSYTYSCKNKTATGGYGLQVNTKDDITITNIEASDNYEYGAHLFGGNVYLSVDKANFINSFNNNGEGLQIVATGAAILDTLQANNNQQFGANIKSDSYVSITDGFFNGNKSYTYSCKGNTPQGYGLQIVSTTDKDISLVNIEANDNNQFGAHLEGGYIFVSYGTFSNTDNVVDQAKGLEIISSGNQTTSLYKVNANNNQEFGTNIQSDGYVSVDSSIFSGNLSYTSGSCKSKTTNGYGLKVVTTNDVYLTGVTASDNGTFGAYLEGNYVSVSNSTFNNNKTSHGLEIKADTVVLNSVTALNNGVDGTKICANDVTVNGSTFNNNKRYGLNVGAPVFSQSGNTYVGNGSTGLFANPSCITTNTNTGGGHNSWDKPNKDWNWGWGWNWDDHKSKTKFGHGQGSSYYGGSSHKSCHAYGKK